LKDPRRPIGSFIFLGPTGIGKTELARALAEYMFDSEDALIKLDMSEFMERHTTARLVGSPPGYVGYDEGGQLTEAVRRRPYSVILFDEIEKAHPEVFNMLLQILEDGRLSDAKGKIVNFANTVIIMTSNLGIRDVNQAGTSLGFQPAVVDEAEEVERRHKNTKEKIDEELKRMFRPVFLTRVDAIAPRMHALERSTSALSKRTDRHWMFEWVWRREAMARVASTMVAFMGVLLRDGRRPSRRSRRQGKRAVKRPQPAAVSCWWCQRRREKLSTTATSCPRDDMWSAVGQPK